MNFVDKENRIDVLIEKATNKLSKGNYKGSANDLGELAIEFAGAGLTLKSFKDMRTYIVESAKKVSTDSSLEEKLKLAEQALMLKRSNTEG